MKRKLCFLFFLLSLFGVASAQMRQISGKVIKDNGEPLIGVNVRVKGSNIATATDTKGEFSLQIPDNDHLTLLITSIGFSSQEVSLGSKTSLSITMKEEASNLNDVVVIGYQTVKRKDLTGSVSSVNAKQLKDVPLNSAAEALAGRLAGVQVTGTEGSPNADVIIRVRGGGSITQDNSPLYIIDGIQVENGLAALSPQDIESIDVLKDASSTAIYGARGANGVVIITTKGGNKNNKTTISYNGLFGINKLAKELDVMNPYDFVVYQWERSRGNSTDSTNFAKEYGTTWDTLSNYRNVPFQDWQNSMFGRDAFMQTHNVSLTGGNQTTQYNLSLTSNAEQGVMLNSDFDRKLVSFKFDHSVSKLLKVGFSTRFNNTIVDGAGTSNTGSASTNRLRQAVKYKPLLLNGQAEDYYDPNYAAETNANSLSLVNPIALNKAEYRKNTTNLANIGIYIDLHLASYLSFRSTLGLDFTDQRMDAFDDTVTNNSKLNGASQPLAGIGNVQRLTIDNSNVFTFSNTTLKGAFNQKNNIVLLAGEETYSNKTKMENQLARYFPLGITPDKALGNMNLGTNYIDNTRPPSSEAEEKLLSFFGRANYTYDNRYLFSFSLRADGSSKFAEGNQWGYFPAGSVAWRISNEKFFDQLSSTINDLKFRVSYGQAGNNRIQNFLYLTQFNTGSQYDLNDQLITAYVPSALANPNLVWETTTSRNIGLDASFLKNRVNLTFDVYKNTTDNLLVSVPVPTSSGYTSQIQNVGSTENRGYEIQLNAVPVQKKYFTWNINFNLSANKNKVTSLGTYQNFYLANSGWGFSNTPADYIVRVGDPVGSMWGFTTDGYYAIDQFNYNATTGKYTLKPGVVDNSGVLAPPQPGSLRFKDLNGDSVINDKDKSIIGVAQPKFFGGLNQQFTYKNFDFSIFINYQIGGDVYNANKLEFTSGYTPDANMLTIMNNRWRTINDQGQVVTDPTALAKLNPNATIWSPSTSSNSFVLHSWAIEDGSFIRINNITLGYSLPQNVIKRIKLQRMRVYFTANNVALITNYSGYDPEVSVRRSNPVTPGVDYSAYPRSRSFIFGVNLSL
jgi:TonB-linked SusC/RagA family outer membrane protein